MMKLRAGLFGFAVCTLLYLASGCSGSFDRPPNEHGTLRGREQRDAATSVQLRSIIEQYRSPERGAVDSIRMRLSQISASMEDWLTLAFNSMERSEIRLWSAAMAVEGGDTNIAERLDRAYDVCADTNGRRIIALVLTYVTVNRVRLHARSDASLKKLLRDVIDAIGDTTAIGSGGRTESIQDFALAQFDLWACEDLREIRRNASSGGAVGIVSALRTWYDQHYVRFRWDDDAQQFSCE